MDVDIYRLICEDSVEERLLSLQVTYPVCASLLSCVNDSVDASCIYCVGNFVLHFGPKCQYVICSQLLYTACMYGWMYVYVCMYLYPGREAQVKSAGDGHRR